MCRFVIENGFATCQDCGFSLKTKETDPNKIWRNCKKPSPEVKQKKKKKKEKARKKGILTKIAKFTKEAISHALNGMPTCSQQQIDERLIICKSCPFYIISKNNPDVGVCDICDCHINKENIFLNKLAWADQECPKGKWLAIPQEGDIKEEEEPKP